jgi:hypothetical protein
VSPVSMIYHVRGLDTAAPSKGRIGQQGREQVRWEQGRERPGGGPWAPLGQAVAPGRHWARRWPLGATGPGSGPWAPLGQAVPLGATGPGGGPGRHWARRCPWAPLGQAVPLRTTLEVAARVVRRRFHVKYSVALLWYAISRRRFHGMYRCPSDGEAAQAGGTGWRHRLARDRPAGSGIRPATGLPARVFGPRQACRLGSIAVFGPRQALRPRDTGPGFGCGPGHAGRAVRGCLGPGAGGTRYVPGPDGDLAAGACHGWVGHAPVYCKRRGVAGGGGLVPDIAYRQHTI